MQKVLLLRFGEIFLKGKNRSYFEKLLIENIKAALGGMNYTFAKTHNRYYVEDFDEGETEEFKKRLKRVFGLHSLSEAFKVRTDYDAIGEAMMTFAPAGKTTFRVTVNRADKSLEKNSAQIGADLGGYVLERRPEYKVDLSHPELNIKVDIRENGYSYVFATIEDCAQGMPVGCSGCGMLLLSGGFDSPVAGYRMARRGMRIKAIHYHSFPYTSEQAKQKVVDLAHVLTGYAGPIDLYVVPFTDIQFAIHEKCRPDYMITIMRRITGAGRVADARKSHGDGGCGRVAAGVPSADRHGQVRDHGHRGADRHIQAERTSVPRLLYGVFAAQSGDQALRRDRAKGAGFDRRSFRVDRQGDRKHRKDRDRKILTSRPAQVGLFHCRKTETSPIISFPRSSR